MTITRRSFLSRGTCAALGTAAAASTIGDLFRIAQAAPAAADYRALVCVFLSGGNDGSNLVVPRAGSDYAAYASARGALALPQSSLVPITPARGDGRSWGLHPATPELATLFSQGRLAIVPNVGPLVAPVTRQGWLNDSVPLPPQLFSHSDQTTHWQTSLPDRPPRTGWGGRAADLLRSENPAAPISLSISLTGMNTFGTGELVAPYQISPDGVLGIDGHDPAGGDPVSRAFTSILALPRTHLLQRTYAATLKRALDGNQAVAGALATAPTLATVFPDTWLGAQLRMVARLISARTALGFSRQVFYVEDGGYDTHSDQLGAHVELLSGLSQALAAFHSATVELGVAPSVTTFTASDFGRTYTSNGGGSDHGWGNHHLVVGGAVKGGDFYGRMPVLAVDGPDDTEDGRWIPATSVDEYSATMARWLGVTDLPRVFPNLSRFAHPDLGFFL
jgi:uncharacterized protein (DUF1501 family)